MTAWLVDSVIAWLANSMGSSLDDMPTLGDSETCWTSTRCARDNEAAAATPLEDEVLLEGRGHAPAV